MSDALENQRIEIERLRADLRTANETISLVAMQRDSWMREAKRLRPDLYPIVTGILPAGTQQ